MDTTEIIKILKKIERIQLPPPDCFIVVDTSVQRLFVIHGSSETDSFTISTSRFGTGNREGSFKTPTGIHRIVEKIGSGAPPGRIFKNRIDTGIDWKPGIEDDNLILTRIVRIEGLEDGINRGHGVDSLNRYIYIHGTNREDLIGKPNSHGCICMRNNDIIQLFDTIEEGTIVVIN